MNGETVQDLGSGAGFDIFIVARKIGPYGKVIGLDMTPEMVDKARELASRFDVKNAKFLLGEIEHIPLASSSVDVVISNCVINLSPNKKSVYQEIFRVLKPEGRISMSDVLRLTEIPDGIKNNLTAYTG